MQPTRIGSPAAVPDTSLANEPVDAADAAAAPADASPAGLSLPANFPVLLSPAQSAEVSTQLERMSLATLPQRDIALLGSETEASLHRTLGSFLQRIEKSEQPRIFKLVTQLREAVDREDLAGLAERILNGQPSMMDKVAGFFSKKAVAQAAERSFEEVRALATGKSKRLSEVITTMEQELRSEQVRLDSEIRSLEQLKTDYRDRFVEFAQLVAFMHGLLEKSRGELAQRESDPNADPSLLPDLRDKLQALESRALAIEGTLSRLPSDQLVIRQLQNAGISTLQETNTTASSRFASIKMTLLTIHGALVTQGVQKLAQQGADLDANLLAVRGALMKDVVGSAASAPGDNRLAQAQQLKTIVDDTRSLVAVVEQARQKNAEQFEQARTMFSQAREEMMQLGQAIRPDKPLSP